MTLELIAGAAVGLPLAWAVEAYVTHRRERAKRMNRHLETFHAAVERLVEGCYPSRDRLASGNDLRSLKWFVTSADKPAAVFVALLAVSKVVKDRRDGRRQPLDTAKSHTVDHIIMIYSWLMVVSYQLPLLGIILRSMVADLLGPDRDPATQSAIEKNLLQASPAWLPGLRPA